MYRRGIGEDEKASKVSTPEKPRRSFDLRDFFICQFALKVLS